MDEANREGEINNNANTSSWWGSWPGWLQTAKEKSSTAYEFMKRDLTEFSQVVQTDAVAAVSSTAALFKEKLTLDTAEAVAGKARQSITSVLDTITDVFAPQKELEDGELMIIQNSEPVVMDWWQTQLYLIRKDPQTFCHEPEGPPEMYENWLESFDPSEHEEEMTNIMITCFEIREIYDKLVPESVSHLEFWQRYFYRVHLLRKAEAKRADLMRRADQISIDDIPWEGDEESHSDISKTTLKEKDLTATFTDANSNVEENSIVKLKPNANTSTTSNQPSLSEEKKSYTETATDLSPKSGDSDHISEEPQAQMDNKKMQSLNNEVSDVVIDPSSIDSTDGSRSSPIESLGQDSSTGDDWEKDFDLELNENDLKDLSISTNTETQKQGEDDWEKWQ